MTPTQRERNDILDQARIRLYENPDEFGVDLLVDGKGGIWMRG